MHEASTITYVVTYKTLNPPSPNRQLTRTVFPAISRILAQRLETTQSGTTANHDLPTMLPPPTLMRSLTLHDTIVRKIGQIGHCGKQWNPSQHATIMGTQLYVKIRSHQLRSNVTLKYSTKPKPYLALVHSNHWTYKKCELQYSAPNSLPFPLTCNHSRITSPLYYYPMNIYYGLYPMDKDISDFLATSYQAELILRLATKPETGWYARTMPILQPPTEQ